MTNGNRRFHTGVYLALRMMPLLWGARDSRDRLSDDIERGARNVRRLRQEKGWSQEAYAHEAGIHRTYVSDIERGARNPSATLIEKLAKPLKVTPGRLLD